MNTALGKPLQGSRVGNCHLPYCSFSRSKSRQIDRGSLGRGSSPTQGTQQLRQLSCRAAAEAEKDESSEEVAPVASDSGNFVPVMLPEELPKGARKEVRVEGVDVLLFWYRNQIYAIEARSPAEGAYSEGFANAKLNQDYCITCPTTGTLFSLKTGEIVDWYPNNTLLRLITPQSLCRKLDIFPVKLSQEAISVDVSGAALTASTLSGRGGADTSIDLNNVFAEETRQYYEGQDPETGEIDEAVLNQVNPYVISVSVFAIAFAGVAGSAFALYKESYILLGLLWVGIIGLAGYTVTNFTPLGNKSK